MTIGVAGDRVYFTVNGTNLWRTDGTPENTVRLAAAVDGMSYAGAKPQAAATLGSDLFFAASGALYRTSADSLTPVPVATLPPYADVVKMTAAREEIYFLTDYDENFWVFDGKSGVTTLLFEGAYGIASRFDMAAVGDTLYFTPGDDLWSTQGTTATTAMLKEPSRRPLVRRPYARRPGPLLRVQ